MSINRALRTAAVAAGMLAAPGAAVPGGETAPPSASDSTPYVAISSAPILAAIATPNSLFATVTSSSTAGASPRVAKFAPGGGSGPGGSAPGAASSINPNTILAHSGVNVAVPGPHLFAPAVLRRSPIAPTRGGSGELAASVRALEHSTATTSPGSSSAGALRDWLYRPSIPLAGQEKQEKE
jgi:hypothetical protein